MDKNTNNTGNVYSKDLPFSAVKISEDVAQKFLEVCDKKVCGPKAAAEVVAQSFAMKDTTELLDWLNANRQEMVYCPSRGEVVMLEAIAICAQGAERIEYSIQHVYHHSMIQNLLAIYENHKTAK